MHFAVRKPENKTSKPVWTRVTWRKASIFTPEGIKTGKKTVSWPSKYDWF